MKGVRQNLGTPHQSRLNAAGGAQPRRSKKQSSKAEHQPQDAEAIKVCIAAGRRKDSPECRIEPQEQRHRNPGYEQHNFSLQVVSDLYFFLMVEGHIIDVVESFGLEKEVSNLP